MPDRDALSEAAHVQNDSVLKQVATGLSKPIRAPLGMAANLVAQNDMLGNFVANDNLKPPDLSNPLLKDANGKLVKDGADNYVRDNRQLKVDKIAFNPGNGAAPQQVEGWFMPPEPGKPVVVFFGGSDFDRNSDSYKDAIKNMAADAKDRGMGFAVYDYPEGVNEETARQFVDQVQNHLQNQHGVALSQQAYAGYSQGSYMASYAAANNPDAAGLHITSGFSSGRMAQKEGIDNTLDKYHLKPLASLIEKRQLSEQWDNIPLAQDIAVRRDQQPTDAKMPVSAAYSDQEGFGVDGNRHMTPLIDNLQGETGGVDIHVSHEPDHLAMLGTLEHGDGMRQFMDNTSAYNDNANRQMIGNGVTLASQQAPKQTVRQQLSAKLDQIGSEQKLREVPAHIKDEYKAEQDQLRALNKKILDEMDPAKISRFSPERLDALQKEAARVQAKMDAMKQDNPGLKQMDRSKVGQFIHSAVRDASKSAGQKLS